MVVVLGTMLFSGISGSSTADTAVIGSTMIPAMKRRGYPPGAGDGDCRGGGWHGHFDPPVHPDGDLRIAHQHLGGGTVLRGGVAAWHFDVRQHDGGRVVDGQSGKACRWSCTFRRALWSLRPDVQAGPY